MHPLSRLVVSALFGGLSLLVACGGGSEGEAGQPLPDTSLDTTLRALLAENQIAAPARANAPDALYSLGLNLFQSTLLSGNQKVSCASCHPIGNAGLDNLPLAIGVHGSGSPPNRTGLPLIHRNTPALMNLGTGKRTQLFWDGRVSEQDGVFTTPAGNQLPDGLTDVLAAQALFPLLSRDEMLGPYDPGDDNTMAELNAPGTVVESNPRPVWNAIMDRLRADTRFAGLLQDAYPGIAPEAMGIEHAANAISAFQSRRWYGFGESNQLHGYINGRRVISDSAKRGGILFFGTAACVRCHSGPLFSDQKFHNLAVPQIGPGFGSGAGESPPRDKGRYEVTGDEADLYAFLTPSLWEVKNTFPYLHNGIYATLEETLRHHLDPAGSAMAFRCPATLRSGGNEIACRDSTTAPALYADMVARLSPDSRAPPALTDADMADLIAFLNVLTDGNNTSVR
ncbi:MAG: hypothetical protein LBP52_09345 [Burkholderiaceae bacterium]|jgi:cytochrome c peroxidase|nr:hypothetical protein [Burkholderiaceae bacterium]